MVCGYAGVAASWNRPLSVREVSQAQRSQFKVATISRRGAGRELWLMR